MDLLKQPDIKRKYERCKYIVTKWENKFKEEHNRRPSKEDIREADSDVRGAYKKYFQLKSAALEQSFKDVEGFDEEQSENIQNLVPPSSNQNKNSVCIKLKPPLDVLLSKESVDVCEHVSEDVWGEHLNKRIKEDKPKSEKEVVKTNLNLNITKKLFCGSKFTKRNPRKSLSFSQKTRSDVSIDNQVSSSQPLPAYNSFPSFTSEEAISLCQEDEQLKNNTFQVITPSEKVLSQPVNIIQSVLEDNYQHTLKTVDTGWLERIAQKVGTTIDNPELPVSSSSHNNNKVTNFSTSLIKKMEPTKTDYDSDDIIDNSDDDEDINDVIHVAKKRKIEIIQSASIDRADDNCFYLQEPNINEGKTKLEVSVNNNETNKEVIAKVTKSEENCVKETLASDRKPNKPRRKSNSRASRVLGETKSKTRKNNMKNTNEQEQADISPRRSARRNKNKISLQELSSGEEDAFHTDTDERDPEFTLDSKSNKFKFEQDETDEGTEINQSKISQKKKRSTVKPRKRSVSNKKISDSPIDTKRTNENQPYELEFSIKPRVVAPRCSNIKKMLTENLAAKKENDPSLSLEDKKNTTDVPVVKDKTQQAKERLEKKIASGGLNDNFVLVNLKKKVFVRGKSGKSFSKYKKAQWKSKRAKALCGPEMDMGGCDGGMLTCYNCGLIGHFAKNCKALKGDNLLPLSGGGQDEEECPYPTLEEASQMAKDSVLSIRIPKLTISETSNCSKSSQKTESLSVGEGCSSEENERTEVENQEDIDFDDDVDLELIAEATRLEEHVKKLDVRMYMDTVKVVNPYYNLKEDGSMIVPPAEVYKALEKFGHDGFRPGQEQAIMRILSGRSTLVTLSTGSGKSLCYQLPAYLYSQREPCISLVISPLVSLMDDQVTGIPKFIKAACLHSNQTDAQKQKILEAISLGELNILLISPEAIVAGEKQIGFGSLLRKLPPIAFACIDEAHCISQWSHNFRPSYLMICRVLRESLGVKTILGLTATATRVTRDSIINLLQIPDGHDGVISDIPLPDNLLLTASRDSMRDHALLGLLMSERYTACKSIIIYCTRRDECERIAAFLRTSLKSEQVLDDTNKKRKRVNLQAEPYHAGISASRRRTIQNRFMSGELRIVVATVAFGMGINKSNIRSVIHYNMPNSFESYVQEVGRAGRDGLPAFCHVFMDSQGRDENELRRHVHANSVDRHVIRKLLKKVFIPCSCKSECPKHEVAFSIDDTVRSLDVPEEIISTLLCYLELHEKRYVEVLSPAYTVCKVISYGGPMQIRKAAKECPPLAMALALHKNKSGEDPNILEFPVIDVAAAMGWESGICKNKLKNLEWISVNNQSRRSSLSVQFSNLGFRLLAPGNLSDDELDAALDTLFNRVVDQEKKALLQLHAVHKSLMEITQPSFRSCISTDDSLIKNKVREYFNSSDPLVFVIEDQPKKFNEEQLISDIRALICMYRDNTFTGRSIARIFQGIQSPNYPATMWGRCKFWRSYLDIDFHTIVRIATAEIIKMR